jgi:hypothetical protein
LTSITAPAFVFDSTVERLGAQLATPPPAEDLVEPHELGELRALLALTDPVERHRAGEARIVAAVDDYVGDHKEYILWPFARPHESRFSDGSYGVLYAGLTFETALQESAYWVTRFFEDSAALPATVAQKQHFSFRATGKGFADIRRSSGGIASIYDPDDYSMSQRWGAALRSELHDGVYYDSVRRTSGECIGAFVPRVASNVKLQRVIEFTWDGQRIADWKAVHPL